MVLEIRIVVIFEMMTFGSPHEEGFWGTGHVVFWDLGARHTAVFSL